MGISIDPKVKKKALNYFFNNNATYAATVQKFKGQFGMNTLNRWVHADERFIKRTGNWVRYAPDLKLKAVLVYNRGGKSIHQICKEFGIKSDSSLMYWIKQFKKYGKEAFMKPQGNQKYRKPADNADEKDKLIYELQLENDILKEVFKLHDYPKAMGLKINLLTVTQKTTIVKILRPKYQFLNNLLDALHLAKSAYDYSKKTQKKKKRVLSSRNWVLYVFETEPKAKNNFGYRQVKLFLRNIGIIISEKVIRRWMKTLGLQPKVKRCRKYNSYMGLVGHVAPNIIDRDFSSTTPHEKWLTDITEFHFNDMKVYLSWIIDCFNGEVIAHTISQSPNMELVLSMLDIAFTKLKDWENPIIHSDMGHQYQRIAYIQKLEKSGCIQSMSKKGCSPDNAACEGSFGIMKREFFHNKNWDNTTYEEFVVVLDDWIDWFNKERSKPALNGLSPVRYRVNHQNYILFDVEPVSHMSKDCGIIDCKRELTV
jgi:transposase InsO family protein/transposase-like protein